MCKKLRDILFPTNLFGKNVVCKSAEVYAPTSMPPSTITHTVIWSGEQLEMTYTIQTLAAARPGEPAIDIREPYRDLFQDGDMSTVTFDITTFGRGHGGATKKLVEDTIYFKCTNVTYLEIDGQQLV